MNGLIDDHNAKHARQRALERYGLSLSAQDLHRIEKELTAGAGMLLRRNRDGQEVLVIRIGTMLATIVFDPARRRIITFKPPKSQPRRKRKTR